MQNHYQMYTYWRDIYIKMHHDHYYKQLQNKQRFQATKKTKTPEIPPQSSKKSKIVPKTEADDDVTVIKLEQLD